MDLELKTNTKIGYISAYIKKNFPHYFRSMDNLEFGKLVGKIQTDMIIKGTNLELVKNGDVDSIIDDYVNEYAEENLNDIWENFDKLRGHILNVISEKSMFNDSKNFLDEVSMKIALRTSDEISFDKIFTGQYDTEIFNYYRNLRSVVKDKIVNVVSNVLISSGGKIGFDEKTTLEIFNLVADKMIENYGVRNIYSVDLIKKMFDEVSRDISRRIVARVRYVMANVDIISDISEREVISQVIEMSTIRGEVSAIRIVDGKMDNFIMNVIKSKQRKKDVIEYVYNVLLNESDEVLLQSELEKFSLEVVEKLKSSEYGFNSSDIIEHRCDKIIRQLYLERYSPTIEIIREKMKRQSIKPVNSKNKKPVDLLKKAMIKKKIQKYLSCLLIIGTLSSAGYFGVGSIINKVDNKKAMNLAKSLDGTLKYSISYSNKTLENSSYKYASDGVIEYYKELVKHGNEYGALCFYNAFSEGFSIDEMNQLMARVRSSINGNNSYAELFSILEREDCFLDYVYDSLLMMGCEEIKNDKYMYSLISYKQSFYGNLYGIASDYHMYADDKNNIEDMLELYKQYSEKTLIKLGNKLHENSVYAVSDTFSENNGSGRRI